MIHFLGNKYVVFKWWWKIRLYGSLTSQTIWRQKPSPSGLLINKGKNSSLTWSTISGRIPTCLGFVLIILSGCVFWWKKGKYLNTVSLSPDRDHYSGLTQDSTVLLYSKMLKHLCSTVISVRELAISQKGKKCRKPGIKLVRCSTCGGLTSWVRFPVLKAINLSLVAVDFVFKWVEA